MFARQNQGRWTARNLATTRPRRRTAAARHWQSLLLSLTAVVIGAVALPQSALGAVAAPGVTFTKLKLINGWATSPFGSASPAVTDISGTVYFKGAISTRDSNTNDVAFVLPPAFRPSKYVNVPVDMCDTTGAGHSAGRHRRGAD